MKQKSQAVAFVHVNVIPMDEERVLKNYSVLVEGKRILAVGPADELEVPGGAKIIEGNGAYLMPGLADMHMHLTFDTDPRSLQFYLAHGVTTIRNFNATHEHFEWRDQVANGVLPGPTILTSGNGLYGVPTFLKKIGIHVPRIGHFWPGAAWSANVADYLVAGKLHRFNSRFQSA